MNLPNSLSTSSPLIRIVAFTADTALLLQPFDAHAADNTGTPTVLWPICIVALVALGLLGWSLFQQCASREIMRL